MDHAHRGQQVRGFGITDDPEPPGARQSQSRFAACHMQDDARQVHRADDPVAQGHVQFVAGQAAQQIAECVMVETGQDFAIAPRYDDGACG